MDTNTSVLADNTTWTVSDYTSPVTTSCVNWYYGSYPTTDRTAKVYEIAKMLINKKMVECRTVKQFTDLMDELLKVV
jgi:hypothetical protein